MKSGTKPTPLSHKDYDYIKTFGALSAPQFPAFYTADRLNWRPNQNIAEIKPVTHSAQPVGCTNFSTAYCANNLLGTLKYSPDDLEAATHANALGGAVVREQIDAARKLGWFPAYYNVRAQSNIDHFDAMRLALMQGSLEHRIVSVGTPWYGIFEAVGSDGMMRMPLDIENIAAWHNHNFLGEITINGTPYLMNESHQGDGYGDKGLTYWSRELVNIVMAVNGSVAYVPARAIENPSKISLTWLEYVISLIRQFGKSWIKFSY